MRTRAQGFTLIEMAIVLIVIGLVLKQTLVPFGALREQRLRISTESQMSFIMESLVGFAAANQRLPCPADANSQGHEVADCRGSATIGFVPVATLGIMGTLNAEGVLTDAWGTPYVYAVSASNHADYGDTMRADFLTEGDMAAVGMTHLAADIVVCRDGLAGQCPSSRVLANQVPFLLMSKGRDTSDLGHQSGNQDGDRVFVSRAYSRSEELPFDDLIVWMSENRFFYQLIQADVLP